MSNRARALGSLPAPGWRNVTAWARSAARNPRQSALVACAVALLVVASVVPLSRPDVTDSVAFSVAFFAALLTGEAVIFALSFSASSAWPSLREIDRHIAFREWVITGWLGAMLTATGLLADASIPAAYGALLFLLADLFGMFSFIRLFGLASAGGRKRLLCRTLGHALAEANTPAGHLASRMTSHPVVNAYMGHLDEAAAHSDGNGVRDLADELAEPGRLSTGRAGLVLHLEVVHRLAKAALVGKLDPVVASSAAEMLIGSLLGRVGVAAAGAGEVGPQLAAAVMGQASRYLAWLASTSLVLSARQVTAAGAARELVAFSVRARQQILRQADPDPKYAGGAHDLGTPLSGPACVLAWFTDFTEFHGACQAAGMYPVFEILTGTKFLGNYWDGDSVLSGLRDALYSGGAVAAGPAADATRAAFGSAGEFDRIWTLVSVGAIATLRDVRLAHPPELIRPEFTPDPQLLGAYIRTFASHRYFTTAEQAMLALAGTVGRTGQHGDLWHRIAGVQAQADWTAPMPVVGPHRRLAACVLAVASRLAPLSAGEPDLQLRAFLAGLPVPVMDATARLAARILPNAAEAGVVGAAESVIEGLRVLQLVGTHRAGAA